MKSEQKEKIIEIFSKALREEDYYNLEKVISVVKAWISVEDTYKNMLYSVNLNEEVMPF